MHMRGLGLIVAVWLAAVLVQPLPAAAQGPQPLSLADIVTAAQQRNPQVAAAQQAVAAAEAGVRLARSGRGPTVTASVTPSVSGGSTSAQTTQGFGTAVSIGTSYVLYDSGQTAHAVRQAEANLKAAQAALEATRQDVAQSAALAYVTVLRTERGVSQSEQVVVQNQELLRLAESQFRAGVVPRGDVVSAQAALAAAEGELIAAHNAVTQAGAALNVTIGLAPGAPIAVAPPSPMPLLTVGAADLAVLVEQRPEVRRALAEIEAAEAALALAQAGSGLRATVNGNVSEEVTPTQQATYAIGVTASLPVSDAGRSQAQGAQATANLAAAQARLQTTRLAVQQQALSGLLSVLDARARISSARAGLTSAQESLRLAQGRYAAGAGTLLEVTGALTALAQANVTLARAEFDELSAVVSLRYALGRSVVDGGI
jgi:outer membrane protein TolC